MYIHVVVDNEAAKNLYMKSCFVYEKWNLFVFYLFIIFYLLVFIIFNYYLLVFLIIIYFLIFLFSNVLF
jgi:hypothetical protein